MLKFVAFSAIVGSIVLSFSQDASAAGRRCRRYTSVWYVPAPVAATVPAPRAPAVAQSGSGSSYRSFSYDSGPTYIAPAPQYQPSLAPSQSRFFRADRKVHGLSWYRLQ